MTAPLLSLFQGGVGAVPADSLNTYVQWTTTAISLRNFTGVTDMSVLALGTNAVNDGGAGFFSYSSTSTAADDGIDVIVPAGQYPGAWVRINSFGGSAGDIYISQLKQALATVDTGARPLVAGNIPANPYNPITICWTGSVFLVNDALYQFVQTQLGYTNAQMSAFYATLATYPVTPA